MATGSPMARRDSALDASTARNLSACFFDTTQPFALAFHNGIPLAGIPDATMAFDAALTVEIPGNAYSALVSFAYNVRGWRGSTLLRLVNAGDMAGAAEQFDRWTLSGGRVMRGLVRRRAAERALFETPGDGDPVSA